jgi:hypothetical protein
VERPNCEYQCRWASADRRLAAGCGTWLPGSHGRLGEHGYVKPVTNFDTANPGKVIFGWETLTNLGGTGACGSATPGNCPVGLQPNVPTNEVFSALGSVDFNTVGPHDYITIVTKGPTASNAAAPTATRKSSIQMLGAYSGNGRIAEAVVGTPPSANYDTYVDQQFRTATPGDTNLVGGVDLNDFNTVLQNFGIGQFWQQGIPVQARRSNRQDPRGTNTDSHGREVMRSGFGLAT